MDWKIRVTQMPGNGAWPARASVPVPRGIGASAFAVRRPDGTMVGAQSRVLTRWPDGSPRWVQLDFQAVQPGEYRVTSAPAAGTPELPVQSRQTNRQLEVTVGRLALTLDAGGASPLAALRWQGRELSGKPWQFIVCDESGQAHPLAAGMARNLTIEADGPQRFQVSWEMSHAARLLEVRFRLEVLAGIEGFTLAYHFFHKLPHHDHLRLRSVEAVCPFEALTEVTVAQSMYSNLGTRRFVHPRHPVTVHVDGSRFAPHVKDAAELDDDFAYPHFLRGCELEAGGAVALANADVALVLSLHELEYRRPKTLTVAPGSVTVGIWPAEAGPLILPQGRSQREVFCFRFTDPSAESVEALLINPALSRVQPAVGWLDKADSIHAGPTWDQSRLFDGTEPGGAYFSHLLQTETARWETVTQVPHYGDVPDWGYTTAYPSQGRTPGGRSDYVFATNGVLHGMFHAAAGLPVVWTNNEYDAIYCLALEALRTRNAVAWRQMTAAARHQIDVDFVHYCDHWQQHRSTPAHSFDHTAGTASIASHQWTQGLYYYYALTGDDDVPDVVRGICDYDLAYLTREDLGMVHYFNRELGWAVVALVFGYEITGDARYCNAARETLRELQNYAGRTDFRELEKHHSTSRGLNATGIGLGFVANTVPLGLKCFHQATGEPWALELLREWVAFGMTNFNHRASGVKLTELFPETFCYVAELERELRYVEDSLWQVRLFFRGHGAIGWCHSLGGPLSTKQLARIYRGLVFLLSALAVRGELPRLEKWLLDGE